MSSSAAVPVWIALGSNLGDRHAHLDGAVDGLRRARGLDRLRASPWFETEPVGGPPGQRTYLNGVLEARCTLSPEALLALLQRIERRHGRDRDSEVRHGPRTLDLDLLLYGELEVEAPGLEIPHPRLEERVFVLRPLATLIPDRTLGRCGRTVRERLAELLADEGAARERLTR